LDGGRGWPGSVDPGHYTALGVTLEPLIRRSFLLPSYRIFGPPSIKSDRYDIVAKVPPGTTRAQLQLMIRNLLADRLGLVCHWETRDLPAYDLVVAKGGSKLKEPEKAVPGAQAPARGFLPDKDGWATLPPGRPDTLSADGPLGTRVAARMQPPAILTGMLEGLLGRQVVDKTGLTGTFDFVLAFALPAEFQRPAPPDAPPPSGQGGLLDAASDPGTSIATALESQLGLKLESGRGTVQVLVVDHVNKTPTED
jgi:uncharacterized protein (TIGR03435 family)